MAIFKVEGGHRLHGSVTPQGAKNEALQILCATLLTPERVVINNIPQILDIIQLIELLEKMGVIGGTTATSQGMVGAYESKKTKEMDVHHTFEEM